jgi:hypothetical protein
MGSHIDNHSGVPYSASLSLPKSSPCKTMPLVFMTRGEREARSSRFYPGARPITPKPCALTTSTESRPQEFAKPLRCQSHVLQLVDITGECLNLSIKLSDMALKCSLELILSPFTVANPICHLPSYGVNLNTVPTPLRPPERVVP